MHLPGSHSPMSRWYVLTRMWAARALQQGAQTPKHQSRYTAVGEYSADIVKTLCNALAAAKRTAPSAAIESRLRSSAASSLCGIHALLSTFVKTKRRRETPM